MKKWGIVAIVIAVIFYALYHEVEKQMSYGEKKVVIKVPKNDNKEIPKIEVTQTPENPETDNEIAGDKRQVVEIDYPLECINDGDNFLDLSIEDQKKYIRERGHFFSKECILKLQEIPSVSPVYIENISNFCNTPRTKKFAEYTKTIDMLFEEYDKKYPKKNKFKKKEVAKKKTMKRKKKDVWDLQDDEENKRQCFEMLATHNGDYIAFMVRNYDTVNDVKEYILAKFFNQVSLFESNIEKKAKGEDAKFFKGLAVVLENMITVIPSVFDYVISYYILTELDSGKIGFHQDEEVRRIFKKIKENDRKKEARKKKR